MSSIDHASGDQSSVAAGSFLNKSNELAVIFKNLTFTVKMKEKIEMAASQESIGTAEQGDGVGEAGGNGQAPVEGKKRKKKFWQKSKTKTVEKNILNEITGVFRAGRLTAVMGASGAGKTTLLSVLAGNVEGGEISGEIQVNGEDFSEVGKMQKISGFVFQDDVLLPTMKVKEAIQMSAVLRLPQDLSDEERAKRVEDIIKILHLKRAAKTKVGDPMSKGISGGERKRTSIAMEIITNPAMLFLDEPTSGLDTFTAYTVIKALQNLAHRQGRTIVSTIHQPSSEIFYLFDDLMILAEGKVVYYGTVENSIEYFSKLGFPCPQYTNPADYFFMNILSDIDETPEEGREAAAAAAASSSNRRETRPISWMPHGIKEKADERIERLLEYWPESPEYKEMMGYIDEEAQRGVSDLSYKGHASYWRQFSFLANRASKNAIRNKSIVLVRLFQSIFIGLILGLVYIDQSQYDPDAQIRNKSGVLFFIAVNQFFASSNQVLAIFYEEKTVFYREYIAGYYRLSAYYWTKILCELPYGIIFPYLMVIIAYYMIGLNPAFSAYLLAGLFAVLAGMCGTATGIFIASCFDSIKTALAILPVVLLPLLLFSGLFASSDALPVYLKWVQYISPMFYAYTGLVINEFDGRELPNCDPASGKCSTEYVYSVLGFDDPLGIIPNIVFLLVIYVVLVLGAFIVLWLKLHNRGGQHQNKKKKP